MTELISVNGVNLEVVSHNDTWAVSNEQVALAFGVTENTIRQQKSNNPNEFLENTHFYMCQNDTGNAMQTMWTKKGVITLGFKIRATPQTIAFRDWASDFILKQRQLTQLEQLQLIAQTQIDVIQKVEKNTNDIEQLKNDITLTSAQKRHLQNAVAQKVYSWQPKEEQTKKLFAKVYKSLKDTFVVSSYMDIKRVDFNNAISLVNALELVDLVA